MLLDATFLLATGSFLLTIELLYLQLHWGTLLLSIEACCLQLEIVYLYLKFLCVPW